MSKGLCIPEGVKSVEDLVNIVIYVGCMSLYNDPEKCNDPNVLEEVARDFDSEEDWEEDELYELPEDEEEEEISVEDEEEAYEKYVKSVKEWCKERWGEHYKSFEECVESQLEDYEI